MGKGEKREEGRKGRVKKGRGEGDVKRGGKGDVKREGRDVNGGRMKGGKEMQERGRDESRSVGMTRHSNLDIFGNTHRE